MQLSMYELSKSKHVKNFLRQWKDLIQIELCKFSKEGIHFRKKINFFSLPEFKKGLFEVQDEGSELLAALVKAEPGQLVMDYCAGSGGKTLAFAPLMHNKGQIFLHDIRSYALIEARKRLKELASRTHKLFLQRMKSSKN